MKKILLLILLFYSFLGFGQEYGVWFTSRENIHLPPPPIRGLYTYVVFVDDIVSELKYLINPITGEKRPLRGSEKRTSELGVHKQRNNPIPIRINVSASGTIEKFNIQKELSKYEYYVGGWSLSVLPKLPLKGFNNMSNILSEIDEFYFYSIVLPYYIAPVDNMRTKNDLLFKTKENTFSDPIVKIPEIIWKYNYDSTGFKEFPEEIKHNFPMKSAVDEILKNENIQPNRSLKIIAELDNSTLVMNASRTLKLPVISSDILSFNIVSDSPELKNIKPVKTACNYSIDGGFTLNLKRDLYISEEETLVMTLYDNNNVLITQEFTSSKLTDNKDGTFGYIWKKLLDPGKYKLKYQTKKGSGGIDKDDPSWLSLIPADFEIGKANKVKFSIINTSDETCFEKSNGYINIKAEGERTFLYQLTKEQVVQFYNGTNWVDYLGTKANDETWFPFISKNNTKIGNLAKGNYRVKVKDSKGCFAR